MDTPTIVSVSNLTKYYGSTPGVQNINFTVNQGEIYNHSLEIRKKCGYVPGSFSAHGNMTCVDFLRFVESMRKAKPKLQENLIDQFQLSQGDLSQKVKYLSHGTLQKLGIIREGELVALETLRWP